METRLNISPVRFVPKLFTVFTLSVPHPSFQLCTSMLQERKSLYNVLFVLFLDIEKQYFYPHLCKLLARVGVKKNNSANIDEKVRDMHRNLQCV